MSEIVDIQNKKFKLVSISKQHNYDFNIYVGKTCKLCSKCKEETDEGCNKPVYIAVIDDNGKYTYEDIINMQLENEKKYNENLKRRVNKVSFELIENDEPIINNKIPINKG